MRILFLAEFYPTTLAADVRGGVEQRTFRLSQAVSRNHEVRVIAGREEGSPAIANLGQVRVVRPGPQISYRQGGGLADRVRFALAARRAVVTEPWDLMFVESFLGYAIMLTLPAKFRQRCFLTSHDVWVGHWISHVGFVTGLIGEVVERLTFRAEWRRWLANSQVTKDKLIAAGVQPDEISIVYNGIDAASYQQLAAESFAQPTVVTVARLVKYKKIDDLLRAFKIVHAQIPNAQLVIIGSGPEEKALQELSHELSLDDVVDWRGFVPRHDDVMSAIKGANVFSLPSAVEGFGIVTAEAMACGTPYVSSDIAPTREVTAGQGGILYPVGNASALADGIVRYLQNPELAQRDGQAGQARAQTFDWAAIESQVEELLATNS